jgi:hypothetical protein
MYEPVLYVVLFQFQDKNIVCAFRKWCSYDPKDYRCIVKDPLKNKYHPSQEMSKRGYQLHYIVIMVPNGLHLCPFSTCAQKCFSWRLSHQSYKNTPTLVSLYTLIGTCKQWVGSFFFVGISPTEIHNKHVQMLAL